MDFYFPKGREGGKGYRGRTARSAVKASTLRLCAVEGMRSKPGGFPLTQ